MQQLSKKQTQKLILKKKRNNIFKKKDSLSCSSAQSIKSVETGSDSQSTRNQSDISTSQETGSNVGSSLKISKIQNNDANFKDLNSSMAYVLTRKFHSFQPRPTLLDDATQGSMLNKCGFKGFHNLIIVFGFITILSQPILRYMKKGFPLNDNLLDTIQKDFLLCLITWPMFYLWSYVSYFLQKAIVKNFVSDKMSIVVHILQISFLFIYCMYQVFTNTWCTSHSGFISMLACTHFMKMHSYFVINREYRKDFQQSLINNEEPLSPYPKNITISNFTLYMWMPVLVYEYEFPRNPTFRPKFLIWKVAQTSMSIIFAYIIVADYIIPYVEMGNKISPLELLCRLILPCCAFTMTIFFIIWEGICNIFAEVTRYADRRFYDDWWNATTYEEYNRKWNRCVYNFLFRHVYLECSYRYKMKKQNAQLCTFFFSALLHEWILVLVFKIARPIMTIFILQQIPLFYLTKHLNKTRAGNMLVWWGLLLGIPLIGTSYLRCDPYVTEWFFKDREMQNY